MVEENVPNDSEKFDVSRRDVMKKAGITSGALVIGSGALAGSAAAQEVSACIDEEGCVVVTYDFRGTGSCPRDGQGGQNFVVETTVTATQTIECQNPGGQIVEAQEQTVTFSTSETVQAKSGRVSGTQTACPDDTDSNPCPNPNWEPIAGDLEVQEATVTLTRAGTDQVCRSETITSFPDC